MSNIVYTHTDERRDCIKELLEKDADGFVGPARIPSDVKITVFQNPGKVAFCTSNLVVGRATRKSDKLYYRWHTVSTSGLRRDSHGNIVAWDSYRSWDYRVGMPWNNRNAAGAFAILGGDTDSQKAYTFACFQEFGVKSLYDVYPIAGEYGLHKYDLIPYNIRPAMRAGTVREYVVRAFGQKRASDRLEAAVINAEPYIVSLAHEFRGLVSDKVLTKFIEDTEFDDEMMERFIPHNPNVRKAIRALPEKSRKKILKSGLDLGDTGRIRNMSAMSRQVVQLMERNLKGREIKSWADLATW